MQVIDAPSEKCAELRRIAHRIAHRMMRRIARRLACSSSVCSLANARITWFIVFGRSFGARGTIALTVSSRSTADVSTKPSEMCCAEGGAG